ncbi:MAG: hypothetical protein LAQ30_02435 [Acidobacteriia bacterium]|nr:hypothetical protein [Terriglobia bacterium]
MLNLKLKDRSCSPQVDKTRLDALDRLYAHFAAVDEAIRALEKYQRRGPSRALALFAAWEKSSQIPHPFPSVSRSRAFTAPTAGLVPPEPARRKCGLT